MNSAEWLISVSKDFFRIEQEMRKLIKSDEKIPVSTLHKGFSDFIFFFFFFLFSSLKYMLKFIYSEKATKFCEISTLLALIGTTQDKSKVEISHNFLAFSEYMNFNQLFWQRLCHVCKVCTKNLYYQLAEISEQFTKRSKYFRVSRDIFTFVWSNVSKIMSIGRLKHVYKAVHHFYCILTLHTGEISHKSLIIDPL